MRIPEPPRREGYHHGHLREALIAAALELIAERGPTGFSFAELARAAGVSPAAPYRHFHDLHAVLAEVARRGFEQFAGLLAAAWNEGRPDPVTAIGACGRAYLTFARTQPAAYVAMFGAGLVAADEAELRVAADRAFAVVHRAAAAVVAGLPSAGRPPALMVALHVWSFSHGIADLFVGPAGRGALPMEPEELLEAGLLVYFRSLAHPA